MVHKYSQNYKLENVDIGEKHEVYINIFYLFISTWFLGNFLENNWIVAMC